MLLLNFHFHLLLTLLLFLFKHPRTRGGYEDNKKGTIPLSIIGIQKEKLLSFKAEQPDA